jgi:hypothetical protein
MNVFSRACGWALIGAMLIVPIGASAQDRVGLIVAAGPVATDDVRAPYFTVSAQRVFKRYFVIEGELSHFPYTLRREIGPHDITGPQGVIGRVNRTSIVDAHSLWNAGGNFLVRSTGIVRVFGGVGISASVDRTDYSQQSFGCSASLDQRICDPFRNERSRGPLPVFRALGGIEVPITRHLGFYSSVRQETSTWEDRADWLSGVAGIRFSF